MTREQPREIDSVDRAFVKDLKLTTIVNIQLIH